MQPDDVDQGTAGSSVEVNGSPAIDCAPEPGQQLLTKSVLGIVITFGFSALVLGAFVRLIDGGGSWWMTGHNLESGEWYEAVRNTVAAVALSVAGGAAYLAYRRQRTADLTQRTAAEAKEIAARAQQTAANAYALTHQQHKLAVERQQGDEIRQLRARFSQAAEHLAHPSPAVRMAGVYAMAALADDWASRGFTSEVQVCIDVLCGYLRLPYDPEHGADHQRKVVVTHVGTDGQKAQEKHFEFRHNDRQVRQTIVRVIASHLRLELEDERSWSNYAFDFRYSHFEDVDFGQAVFNGRDVLFDCATFSGERTSFYESLVSGERTSFRGATFNAKETDFDKTTFNAKETDFSQATFNGMQTDFDATTFNGTYSDFSQATFNNAEETHFGATFNAEETNFGGATFNAERTHFGAIFNGEWVSLGGATFNGKRVSLRGTFNAEQTKFDGATFNAEETDFFFAAFNGKSVSFTQAIFNGKRVSFRQATFNAEQTKFDGATFNAEETDFFLATFNGRRTEFSGATFNGTQVSFKSPQQWLNVYFDWDNEPSQTPACVLPRDWPPTPVTPSESG